MPNRPRVPKLWKHGASGRAVVKHKGKFIYFGKYGSAESDEAYRRWVAQLMLGEPTLVDEFADESPSQLDLAELGAAFLEWAEGYYQKNGNPYERFVTVNRAFGPLSWAYWIMVACNVGVPQLLWFKTVRNNLLVVFILTIFVNIGMWFERFVIIVISLHRDFLPSSWADYTPTLVKIATFVGSFGLFFTCFLVFCRLLPMIAIGEIKGVLGDSHE